VFAFTAGRLTISLLEFRMDTLGIPVVQVLQDHQAPAPRTGGLTHVPRRLIGVSQISKPHHVQGKRLADLVVDGPEERQGSLAYAEHPAALSLFSEDLGDGQQIVPVPGGGWRVAASLPSGTHTYWI
jgi:hypothetical protein